MGRWNTRRINEPNSDEGMVEKQCECGDRYWVRRCHAPRSNKCPQCQMLYERNYKKGADKRERTYVTVIHDPLTWDEGGFSKGAQIMNKEWEFMKKMDGVLTPGFQAKMPDGRIEMIGEMK